ncbi:MAG: hypothetical protein GXY83_13385 [Rhodopirellula sp.]|nr:hypothetical protein [Rhodopirellula sp.]
MPHVGSGLKCVMTLDERRQLVAGNPNDLRAAVARGADLRSYSEFIHNEHIDPKSTSAEPVQESMDMRCTYLLDRRWVAGRLKPATLDLCHRLGLDPPLILAIRMSIAQPCFSAPCGCSGVGVTPGPWPRRFWL